MELAWEQKYLTKHGTRCNPREYRSPRVLGYFELNWPPGLVLDDGCAIANAAAGDEVHDLEPNQITAARFAVDREIEQREVAQVVCELEPRSNGPDLPWQERTFLADQPPFVPRRALRSGCWKLDLDMVRSPSSPSTPCIGTTPTCAAYTSG